MKPDLQQVIARVREMQKWRRGEPPYDDGDFPSLKNYRHCPVSPAQFGQDIDALISALEQAKKIIAKLEWHILVMNCAGVNPPSVSQIKHKASRVSRNVKNETQNTLSGGVENRRHARRDMRRRSPELSTVGTSQKAGDFVLTAQPTSRRKAKK